MQNQIRADMLKVKRMVSEVEMIIGKREGETELVNKLIDAENLLTYCMSRLENAFVPPCKVGETAYWIENDEIRVGEIIEIERRKEPEAVLQNAPIKETYYGCALRTLYGYEMTPFKDDDFGVKVFVGKNAKDQAKQKLKESEEK